MPHVRKREYQVPNGGYELKYVEIIQRHHKVCHLLQHDVQFADTLKENSILIELVVQGEYKSKLHTNLSFRSLIGSSGIVKRKDLMPMPKRVISILRPYTGKLKYVCSHLVRP